MIENLARIITASATFLTIQSANGADELQIRPGLWESTITVESSFMPSMPPQTTRECVKESAYDVRDMLKDQGECRITNTSIAGSTLRWTMACDMEEGARASGHGEVTSQGDRIEGGMTMEMNMQGQSFNMKTTWTGKRIGDC
jgi:hypothetical protein